MIETSGSRPSLFLRHRTALRMFPVQIVVGSLTNRSDCTAHNNDTPPVTRKSSEEEGIMPIHMKTIISSFIHSHSSCACSFIRPANSTPIQNKIKDHPQENNDPSRSPKTIKIIFSTFPVCALANTPPRVRYVYVSKKPPTRDKPATVVNPLFSSTPRCSPLPAAVDTDGLRLASRC